MLRYYYFTFGTDPDYPFAGAIKTWNYGIMEEAAL